jgi:hypothetical protein
MNLPMDHTRPWDLKGSLLFFNILKYHYRGCAKFVKSNQFQDYLRHRKADLIIIDHFLQVIFEEIKRYIFLKFNYLIKIINFDF